MEKQEAFEEALKYLRMERAHELLSCNTDLFPRQEALLQKERTKVNQSPEILNSLEKAKKCLEVEDARKKIVRTTCLNYLVEILFPVTVVGGMSTNYLDLDFCKCPTDNVIIRAALQDMQESLAALFSQNPKDANQFLCSLSDFLRAARDEVEELELPAFP